MRYVWLIETDDSSGRRVVLAKKSQKGRANQAAAIRKDYDERHEDMRMTLELLEE